MTSVMEATGTWSELLASAEHSVGDVDAWQVRFGFDDDTAALFRGGYPSDIEVGERVFFPPLDDVLESQELAWPSSWLPLEDPQDHVTLVLCGGKVWLGYRRGEAELGPQPLWESLDAFAADLVTLRAHEAYDGGEQRWLKPSAERALRQALDKPAWAFDFFRIPTLEARRAYLQGEIRAARIVVIVGLFFMACSLAFLAAPFGSLAIRVPFVVVVGCVPFAIALYGSRASKRARHNLTQLPVQPGDR